MHPDSTLARPSEQAERDVINDDEPVKPLHPICFDYDDFAPAELDGLRKSLRAVGLLHPITTWRDVIVDGKHREKLCRALRIQHRFDDITKKCPTEEDMRKYVEALNEHRRSRTTPLTPEEKRAKAAGAIKADPARSDQAIHEAIPDVSKATIQRTRKDLEDKGVVQRTTPAERKSRTGKVGEGQRKTETKPAARKPKCRQLTDAKETPVDQTLDERAREERVDCIIVHSAINAVLDAIGKVTPERVAAGVMAYEVDEVLDDVRTLRVWLNEFSAVLNGINIANIVEAKEIAEQHADAKAKVSPAAPETNTTATPVDGDYPDLPAALDRRIAPVTKGAV
jgi:hypothetical protein